MSITVTQYTNELAINESSTLRALEMRYEGTIDAELTGNNVGGCNNSKIIIAFLSYPKGTFMTYDGDLTIRSIKAYGYDSEEIPVTVEVVTDEMQTLGTGWDSSTSKYEELNKSKNKSKVKKTKFFWN